LEEITSEIEYLDYSTRNSFILQGEIAMEIWLLTFLSCAACLLGAIGSFLEAIHKAPASGVGTCFSFLGLIGVLTASAVRKMGTKISRIEGLLPKSKVDTTTDATSKSA
jgi:hypothetical protein